MNPTLSCLIVDDEPSAQQVLQQYIDDTPGLELKHTCNNAIMAMEVMREYDPDIVFLDINIPKLSGIDFLKSIKNPPAVILSTAYDNYALEGYQLDVTDYLLKPFSFERFLQAVRKAEDRNSIPSKNKTLTVKADGRIYRISLNEIVSIESQGDYVTMHLENRKITYYETLKNLDKILPDKLFVRVHKSFIIQISKVDYMEGNMLSLGDQTIPIGNTYRDNVQNYFS